MEFLNISNAMYTMVAIATVGVMVMGNKKKSKIMQAFRLNFDLRWQWLKLGLMVVGLLMIVLALMGPVVEDGVTEVKGEGLDMYVLIDTSNSMLVEDVVPSRLGQAKGILTSLLESMDGDRIGFIPFASSAYVQMPLTDDYDLAEMFVDVIDTDMISGGGSDVDYAIQVAVDAFEGSTQGDKIMLILSDGEAHESEAAEVIKNIKDKQIKVFSIGMGTSDGGLIPEYDIKGQEKIGYKKDGNGQTVMSRLNEDLLKNLAQVTGGKYYRGQNVAADISGLKQDMSGLVRGNQMTRSTVHYKHYYQIFLGIGMVLLLLGLLLPERGQSNG